mgnify:CR=1 FL=1
MALLQGLVPSRLDTGSERGLVLLVGLGNPGTKYALNRHNVGFQVLDLLAKRHGLVFERQKNVDGLVAKGRINGRQTLLLKPQTFMNHSGRSVRATRDFYRVTDDDIIVVYDDLDLPLGRLRFRPEGGAGGQGGMRSIIQHLGTESFARLRIGIDRPPGRMDPAAYVLQNFSDAEEEMLAVTRQEAADGLELWLTEDTTAAMNRYNG